MIRRFHKKYMLAIPKSYSQQSEKSTRGNVIGKSIIKKILHVRKS
jgi:hypothetical protein